MIFRSTATSIVFTSLFKIIFAREFAVLSDLNSENRWISELEIEISDTTSRLSTHPSALGCSDGQLTLFCDPSAYPNCSSTIILHFKVNGLIMGPDAGRAYVFQDEIQIASCVFETCSINLDLEPNPAADCPRKTCASPPKFEISIRLFALESTLQYEEVIFLGDCLTRQFLVALRNERDTESLVDFEVGKRLPLPLCTDVSRESDQEYARVGRQQVFGAEDGTEVRGVEEPKRVAEEGESSDSQQGFMRKLIQDHPDIREVLKTSSRVESILMNRIVES